MKQIINYDIITTIVGKLETDYREIFLYSFKRSDSDWNLSRSEKDKADYLLFPDPSEEKLNGTINLIRNPDDFTMQYNLRLHHSNNNTYQTKDLKHKFTPLISRLN